MTFEFRSWFRPMLSSRPVQLATDAPYLPTKTPGRTLANRSENDHAGTLTANLKGKNANAVPRTPFQPASAHRQKLFKDQKPGLATTTTRRLQDKTPLPNRIGTMLFQTPLPQKQNVKSSKLAFIDPDANQTKSTKIGGDGKTPDSAQRPSSMRKHVKHPRSVVTQNFETPMNRGNHWDISDGDIVLPVDVQPALQDTIMENDDLDEIEFMAPNTLDLPYQPPLDFELPDYKLLGRNLRHLAYSCPYDDSPSPPAELDIAVSDLPSPVWDMLRLPPLSLEDDPFHRARAELAQASSKPSVYASKTRLVTKTGLQPSSLATNQSNPVLLSKITRNTSQPQRTPPIASAKPSRPETATSIGTATTNGTTAKGTTSKVVGKPVPSTTRINTKGTGTTATGSVLPRPVKPTYHKSAVSLSSRPVGVVTRVATNVVRRPHTALDGTKKHDKPVGSHGALLLVKDLNVKGGGVIGEDFMFDV